MNWNRLLKYINYSIALLLLAALGAAGWFAWRVLPRTSGTVRAPVSSPVAVVRDRLGVPHITAASAEDAYFVQGYVTAQDRLFQLEVTRRQAAGHLAEIFGARALENDLEARRLRMRRVAEQHARTIPPADRAVLAAYARGVNFFLETHQGRFPLEFSLLRFDPAPWTIADSILVGLQMFRSLTTTWRDEIAKAAFAAEANAAKADFLFPVRTGGDVQPGSNAWVVGGARTRSGKPILANDPHLGTSLPGIWYQVRLKTPEFNVAGVSLPGVPAIIIGRNEHIAWGMTNLHFDVQDLYREQVNLPAGVYLFQGRPEPVVQEREAVRIRGAAPADLLLFSTRHGPIFLTEQNRSYALRWAAAEPGLFAFPFADINRARNWTEFRSALQRFPGPAQNFVYADVEGNIGYQAAGMLPVRRTWDGDVPVAGPAGGHEWDGFIPFERLPSSFNPPSGLIITANQNPFPEGYPYRVNGNFAPHYRSRQIHALLTSKQDGWQPADMLAVQKDVYSAFSHLLARHMVAAYKRRGLDSPSLAESARLLEAWNGQMEKGMAAPLLVTLTFQHLRKAVAETVASGSTARYDSQMAPVVVEQLLHQRPADWLPDYDQWLLRAWLDALEEGARSYGRDVRRWDYGRYNQWVLRHPLLGGLPVLGRYFRIGPVPMSGSSTTVKQTTQRLGPSMRMVIDMAKPDGFLLNIVTGQSGQVFSSHYKDQWEAYYSATGLSTEFGTVRAGPALEFVPR